MLPANKNAYASSRKSQRKDSGINFGKSFPAGLKLLLCMGLSIIAFTTRTPITIGILFIINAALILVLKSGPITLTREIKVLCWQTALITGLYIFRFGFSQGVIPGILTSMQLFLAFFPGVIFIQTTPQEQIVMTMEKILPYKAAFVLAKSIKFMPMMLKEVKNIYEAQVFRGARILPKDLLNPFNWKDMMHCIVFPAIVHGMVSASEIAAAAKARGFGKYDKRTNWPGD